MPLILAIEPDRRQAGQLTAMVRGRLHAELVLGDSAERALAALGQRIPDLVLTSALLSPKDEATLGERLRALDGAAVHVQTLTIPLLASPSRSAASRAGGVLSALRRDKSKASAPDGCDPAVFAEQCKEYLERAAADREAFADQAASAILKETREASRQAAAPSPVTGSEWVVVREDEPADLPQSYYSTDATAGRVDSDPAVAEFQPIESDRFDQRVYEPPPPDYARSYVAAPDASVLHQESSSGSRVDRNLREILGLREDGEGPASLLAAVAALEAEERVVVPEPAAAAPVTSYAPEPRAEEPRIEEPRTEESRAAAAPAEGDDDDTADFDLSSLLQTDAKGLTRSREEEPIEVYELDAGMLANTSEVLQNPTAESTRAENRSWPILEDLVEGWKPKPAAAPAAPPAAPEPDNLQEWDDILEALRRDAEQPPPAPASLSMLGDAFKESPKESAPAAASTSTLSDAFKESPKGSAPAAASTSMLNDSFKESVREPAPAAAPTPEPAEPIVAPARDAASTNQAAATEAEAAKVDAAGKKKKKKSKTHPAQDEWGFFDPEQCGFAALIEKLEEITDKDEAPKPKRA